MPSHQSVLSYWHQYSVLNLSFLGLLQACELCKRRNVRGIHMHVSFHHARSSQRPRSDLVGQACDQTGVILESQFLHHTEVPITKAS